MAAPKTKSKAETTLLRAQIAGRYVRGDEQATIAQALGLTQPAISYHLQIIEAEWARQYAAAIDAAKWAQLARVDELERTYWQAWADSREAINRQTQTADVPDPSKPARPSRVVQVTEERSGDPRWLAGVQWCIETRCKILGLWAPERRDVTSNGETIKVYGVDPDGV